MRSTFIACAAALLGRDCTSVRDIVIGSTAGPTLMEQSAAAGLRAAYEDFRRLTRLPLQLVQLNHTDEGELGANVERLVEEECAYVVVGRPGTSLTEGPVLELLRQHRVPLVSMLSGSEQLRNMSRTAVFGLAGDRRKVTLPTVANVRASAGDELRVVLMMLSRDWESLSRVALVGQDTPLCRWTFAYLNGTLSILANKSGLLSHHVFRSNVPDDDELEEADAELFGNGTPEVLIVSTVPNTTVPFIKRLARSEHRDLTVYLLSWSSAEDLIHASGSREARADLARRNIRFFFTQAVPYPTPGSDRLARGPSLLRKFGETGLSLKSHAALEGYLAGWFVYEVTQQAVARYGRAPADGGPVVTRGDFLYTLFVDVRTFNVLGLSLGPYGDGGASGGPTPQNADDACNQGFHEIFLTRLELVNATQLPVPGASMKFTWCSGPMLSQRSALTVIGSVLAADCDADTVAHTGLTAALRDYRSATPSSDNNVLVHSVTGSLADAVNDLRQSDVVAVVSPRLPTNSSAGLLDSFAVIAPVPGFWGLYRPFRQGIINMFPSSQDEMHAAFEFLESRALRRVAVLSNSADEYTAECASIFHHIAATNKRVDVYQKIDRVVNATDYVRNNSATFDGFLVLGGAFDSAKVEGVAALRLFNSQVASSLSSSSRSSQSTAWNYTYRISVSPPPSLFASTSPMRTAYDTWVSSEDADEVSFRSFIVGQFLTQVIDKAKSRHPNTTLTADDLVEAVYEQGVFTIEGVQIGPFKGRCSSSLDCCNQGLNTVYVLHGIATQRIVFNYSAGDCGRTYVVPSVAGDEEGWKLGVGLGVGLGGAVVLCSLVLAYVLLRSKRTVEYLNIRRGEIDLGQCMGQGRFGPMYVADWHGTTVAVRVIDKKSTPREDQRLIKDEVLLLHKHHHPNLLMLMGFCETRYGILIVTEFMEGGTLADYLTRGKRYAPARTLISMAFDVLKGIAYLHSCKPPIVHGSICSRNLLLDGRGTVKISDLWFRIKKGGPSAGQRWSQRRMSWQPPEMVAGTFLTQATDVYSFGIVLWHLIAPPELARTSSATGTVFDSISSDSVASTSNFVMRMTASGFGEVEMLEAQVGPPEIPAVVPRGVADLLDRCWQTQPERRPSVFHILRHWQATFSEHGAFEMPKEVDLSSRRVRTRYASNCSVDNSAAAMGEYLADDMAASVSSVLPASVDAEAARRPQDPAECSIPGLCAESVLNNE
eukprot:m51a1_g8815 putative pas domain-containing protein tyrosine kinase (1221) ;mRNA; r:305977-310716